MNNGSVKGQLGNYAKTDHTLFEHELGNSGLLKIKSEQKFKFNCIQAECCWPISVCISVSTSMWGGGGGGGGGGESEITADA